MKIFSFLKTMFDKIFGKECSSDSSQPKNPQARQLPNGEIEMNGARYLPTTASKALNDEFKKSNPDLVNGPEWN